MGGSRRRGSRERSVSQRARAISLLLMRALPLWVNALSGLRSSVDCRRKNKARGAREPPPGGAAASSCSSGRACDCTAMHFASGALNRGPPPPPAAAAGYREPRALRARSGRPWGCATAEDEARRARGDAGSLRLLFHRPGEVNKSDCLRRCCE